MPEDFKLFFPVHRKKCVREEAKFEEPKVISETIPPAVVAEPPIFETELSEDEIPAVITERDLVEELTPEIPREEIEGISLKEEEERTEGEDEEVEKEDEGETEAEAEEVREEVKEEVREEAKEEVEGDVKEKVAEEAEEEEEEEPVGTIYEDEEVTGV